MGQLIRNAVVGDRVGGFGPSFFEASSIYEDLGR